MLLVTETCTLWQIKIILGWGRAAEGNAPTRKRAFNDQVITSDRLSVDFRWALWVFQFRKTRLFAYCHLLWYWGSLTLYSKPKIPPIKITKGKGALIVKVWPIFVRVVQCFRFGCDFSSDGLLVSFAAMCCFDRLHIVIIFSTIIAQYSPSKKVLAAPALCHDRRFVVIDQLQGRLEIRMCCDRPRAVIGFSDCGR